MKAYFTLPIIAAVLVAFAATGAAGEASPYTWACAMVRPNPMAELRQVCADASCNPVQANIVGRVIILSTSSMAYTHGGFNPAGGDPASCCGLARATDTANAWSFCSRKGGCGAPGSCTAYVASLSAEARNASKWLQLPAAGFGPFGGCNADDGTFLAGTCSLKAVADTGSPQVYGHGDAAEGWISGVVPKPSTRGCPPGMTLDTCKACNASKAPSACFRCAARAPPAWLAGPNSCAACAATNSC